MKTLVYIVTCAVLLSVISCTSRNKGGDDVQVLMKDSTVISAPQRMQVSDTKVTITYKGREYRSSVVRRPDESLPVVTNEQGERFIDNSIALRITCGGKQMYHTPLEETYITRQLVSVDRKESWEMAHANEGFSLMTLADFGIG